MEGRIKGGRKKEGREEGWKREEGRKKAKVK